MPLLFDGSGIESSKGMNELVSAVEKIPESSNGSERNPDPGGAE